MSVAPGTDAHGAEPALSAAEHARILEMIARGKPLGGILEAITLLIESHTPGSRCSILLLSEDGVLHHGAAPNLPAAYRDAIDGISIGEGVGSCGTASIRREPVYSADIESDPLWDDFRELALAHGLRACWSTPIFASNARLLGTFAVYFGEPGLPDASHQALIGEAANLASIAIEHALAGRTRIDLMHEQIARGHTQAAWERLRDLVELSPDGITFVSGPRHIFELANERYFELAGRTAEQLLGKPAREVFPELESTGIFEILDHVYATGETFNGTEMPVTIRRNDVLQTALLDFVYKAFRDDRGEITGVFVHVTDVTAQVNLRKQAEALAEEARAASAAKDDFLGMMSHEMRTPLTVINGGADILERRWQQLPAAARNEMLSDIRRESAHLLSIVDNLLLMARIDLRDETEPEPCMIVRLVRNVVRDFEKRARGRRILLAAAEDSPLVECHAVQLEQVVRNLLTNADKYSPPGLAIEVCVERLHSDVRVTIADHGPGISDDEKELIFNRFYRSKKTEAMAGGSGLGLALCKRIIENMGGNISARNREGGGFEIAFTLPTLEP